MSVFVVVLLDGMVGLALLLLPSRLAILLVISGVSLEVCRTDVLGV